MKKTLAFLCAGILLFSATAGCSTGEPPPESQSAETPASLVALPSPEPEIAPDDSAVAFFPAEEEAEPPPTAYIPYNWAFAEPEERGVDGSTLKSFHNALANVNIQCAVTVKDGYIIDEYYKEGFDENSVFRFNSCTKSFSGALIGIAVEKGLLSGVDAKLTEFFPQLSQPNQADKQDITVEHLLTQTSGMYWNEWSGGDYFMRLSRSENWVDFVLSQAMVATPGKVFNYTTGGSHLLGAVIQSVAGITAYEFGVEHLFKPLGMESVQWRADPQGISDSGNGISMTARDAAKFGQLYLNNGKWDNVQVIPEKWVSLSVAQQAAGSPGTGEYGYSWWLKRFGTNGKWYSTYYAMGAGGQYIFVVPELNLVTVMASRVSDAYTPQYYFNDYVMAACM